MAAEPADDDLRERWLHRRAILQHRYGHIINSATVAFTTPAFTSSGWFLGGGVETTFDFFGMLGKGWFWRNEYRYANYGNKTVADSTRWRPIDIAFKPVVQTVTSQVVFKFN